MAQERTPAPPDAAREDAFAVSSKEQLLGWLDESGRRFFMIDAHSMVEALPFPEGIQALQLLIAQYRMHRALMLVELPDGTKLAKGDQLEPDELRDAAAWCTQLAAEIEETRLRQINEQRTARGLPPIKSYRP